MEKTESDSRPCAVLSAEGNCLDPVFTISKNGQLRSGSHMASKAQVEDDGFDGLLVCLLRVLFQLEQSRCCAHTVPFGPLNLPVYQSESRAKTPSSSFKLKNQDITLVLC